MTARPFAIAVTVTFAAASAWSGAPGFRGGAAQTALLLAVLIKRSGFTRARVSRETIRFVSRRRKIRLSFTNLLTQRLDDLGLVLMELDRGGFGLIRYAALDGAPAITAKRYFADELQRIRREKLDFEKYRRELNANGALDQDDE